MSNNNDDVIKGFNEKSIVENRLDNIFASQNPQKNIQFGDVGPANLNNDWIVVSACGHGPIVDNRSKAEKEAAYNNVVKKVEDYKKNGTSITGTTNNNNKNTTTTTNITTKPKKEQLTSAEINKKNATLTSAEINKKNAEAKERADKNAANAKKDSGKNTASNSGDKKITANQNGESKKSTVMANPIKTVQNIGGAHKTYSSAPGNQSASSSVSSGAPMTGAPTSSGTTYWFASYRIGEIEGTLKTIILVYRDIKNQCVTIAEKMKEYVNVGGKWNDANSKLFAEWWNGGMTGSLIAKPGEGLQIESSGVSYTIKEILNRCSNLYWLAICRQLYFVVNMKYPQQQNNMGDYTRRSFLKGADESYTTVSINTDNVWTNLMAELSSDSEFNWQQLNLTVENSSNGGSSTTELEAFIQVMSEEMHKLSAYIDNFTRYMGFVISDTPTDGNYFGFTPNPNIAEALKYFENEKTEFITAFETNIKNALSMYGESVNNKMNEYLSTKYNLN